jgi:hypothetical protein
MFPSDGLCSERDEKKQDCFGCRYTRVKRKQEESFLLFLKSINRGQSRDGFDEFRSGMSLETRN